jgi:predicted enzyme involved in methoxymalonyl-ACP biosynthesis
VIGEYPANRKNAMVADIYKRLGFAQVSDTLFTAEPENFVFNKTYIQKGNDSNE